MDPDTQLARDVAIYYQDYYFLQEWGSQNGNIPYYRNIQMYNNGMYYEYAVNINQPSILIPDWIDIQMYAFLNCIYDIKRAIINNNHELELIIYRLLNLSNYNYNNLPINIKKMYSNIVNVILNNQV